jgi:hypothetical protein
VSFYADLRATADGLLTDKGQSMTLTKTTAGTYDPETGTSTPTTEAHTVTGVVLDYPNREIDGTLILRGDKKVLVSADGLAVDPAPQDTLTFGGVVNQVIDAKPLRPAGTVVLWTLQVRNG